MEYLFCADNRKRRKFYPVHKHPFWELLRVTEGRAIYTAGGEKYELAIGDLILIPPNTPHNCQYKEYFSDAFVQFSDCDLPPKPILIHDTDGNIGRLCSMMDKISTERETYHYELLESILNTIFIYIKKSLNLKVEYPFVYTFKNALYKNLPNPDYNIGNAILESGYNPDYFRRCFKKEFNSSPLEYLNLLRITRAKQLLIQDDFTSIEEVAAQCGFTDNHYFSTFFKKHTGISPLQYRKKELSRSEDADG